MFRFIPKDGRPVRQAQRKARAHHTHRYRAGNLCRNVGSQQQNTAGRPVHDLIGVLQQRWFESWHQHIKILERRKDNLVVTETIEVRQQFGFQMPNVAGSLRKDGGHPDRNQ